MTKHLMTGPSGNSEFCFLASVNIEGLGETKLTVSFWTSHALSVDLSVWFNNA